MVIFGSCKHLIMRSKGIVLSIVILFSLSIMVDQSETRAIPNLQSPGSIVIDGYEDLLNSTYLTGGNGTEIDPYILGNIPWNVSNIQIVNITYWLEIRDQEIDIDSDTHPLMIKDVRWCILDNVTVIDDNDLLKVENRTNITIRNSTFVCTSADNDGTGYPVRIETFENTTIFNSTFDMMRIDSGTHYHFLHSDNLFMKNTSFNRATIWADVRFSNRSLEVIGCTFQNGSRFFSNSYHGPLDQVFLECHFNNSILDMRGAYCYSIMGNSFSGEGSGIYLGFELEGYIPHEYNQIINNTFERSKGVLIYNTWHGTFGVKKMIISGNYFGNCTGKAIDFTHTCELDFVYIWRNIFYHNGGTGDDFNGLSQAETKHGFFNQTGNTYQFDRGGMGNFWQDWRGPDENGDGIVDQEYLIRKGFDQLHANITDRYPVTNRYFDTERPHIRIIEPNSTLVNHTSDYVKLVWEAWDNISGLESVHFSNDGGNWTNVTGEDWWPVKMVDEKQEVYLKAYDKAGLYNITSLPIELAEIIGPVSIDSPDDGEIILSSDVSINWSVSDYFPLLRQELFIGGEPIEIEPADRSRMVELDDGSYHLNMTFKGIKGTVLSREIDFMVDTKSPDITVNSPYQGAVLSNKLVNFNWSVEDINGISEVRWNIDGGVWSIDKGVNNRDFFVLLEEGDHILDIITVDMAGRLSRKTVDFSIGEGTLKIIEPGDGHITNISDLNVRWEIERGFDSLRMEVEHIETQTISDVTSNNYSCTIILIDGTNRIKVTATDIHGNYVSDMVRVILDREAPDVRILNEDIFVNDDPLPLEWSALDENGIKSYSYRFDDGEIVEAGLKTGISKNDLDEGPHSFEIFCTDKAGNVGSDRYDFIFDSQPPVVDIASEKDPAIFLKSLVDLEWTSSDDNEIRYITLKYLEEEMDMEVDKRDWQGTFDDGTYLIEIIAEDMAGNTGNDTLTIIIDTVDPELEWLEPIIPVNSLPSTPVRFRSSDSMGIDILEILEDDQVLWTGTGSGKKEVYLELDEGSHDLVLNAYDSSGRTSRIERTIIVDRTDPVIEKFEQSYANGILAVKGRTSDEHSSVKTVEINAGGIVETFEEPEYSWSVEDLEPGEVIISINVTDEAGNSVMRSIQYEVPGSSGSGDDGKGSWIPLVMVISAIIIVIIVSAGFFFYLKKKDEVEEEEEAKEKMEIDRRIMLPSREETMEKLGESGFRSPPRLGSATVKEVEGPEPQADNEK